MHCDVMAMVKKGFFCDLIIGGLEDSGDISMLVLRIQSWFVGRGKRYGGRWCK